MARLARPELHRAVNSFARDVTRWTAACDKRLRRLVSFIYRNRESDIKSCIGNKANERKLVLFCDASFAGDLKDGKSTSGSLLCLVGSRLFCPIAGLCKKKRAMSHSSAEAEIIGFDTELRLDGIPAMSLWDPIISVLKLMPQISYGSPNTKKYRRVRKFQISI